METALQSLRLDQMRVLPTGRAWHKLRFAQRSGNTGWPCARLAFGDLPGVVIDRREIDRPGSSYTVDTVEELSREQPGVSWFLLIGEDQYRSFHHLAPLAGAARAGSRWVVAARPGDGSEVAFAGR